MGHRPPGIVWTIVAWRDVAIDGCTAGGTACTPVVAAISDQVSLVAVAANGSGAVITSDVVPVGATAIDAAPDSDRGIAAAMTLVFRLLGMTIGIRDTRKIDAAYNMTERDVRERRRLRRERAHQPRVPVPSRSST